MTRNKHPAGVRLQFEDNITDNPHLEPRAAQIVAISVCDRDERLDGVYVLQLHLCDGCGTRQKCEPRKGLDVGIALQLSRHNFTHEWSLIHFSNCCYNPLFPCIVKIAENIKVLIWWGEGGGGFKETSLLKWGQNTCRNSFLVSSRTTPLLFIATVPTDSKRCQKTHQKNSLVSEPFSNSAPKLWNALPQTTVEADSLVTFLRHLKTHLFCEWLHQISLKIILIFLLIRWMESWAIKVDTIIIIKPCPTSQSKREDVPAKEQVRSDTFFFASTPSPSNNHSRNSV